MRKSIRWLLALAAVALLVVGVLVVRQVRRASDTLGESERIEERILHEVLAQDGRRPTLGSPAKEGDARAIYDTVLPLLEDLGEEEQEVLRWVEGLEYGHCNPLWGACDDLRPDLGIVALVERTRPLLDSLRPALTVPTVRPRHALTWPEPDAEESPQWQTLSKLVSVHVHFLVAKGDVGEALDLCVLRWFAGLDCARNTGLIGYLTGLGVAESSVTDIRRILADCEVSKSRLDRLAEEIDLLRSAKPEFQEAYRIEEMYMRHLLGEQAKSAGSLSSDRFLIARALEAMTATREAVQKAVRGKPGHEAKNVAWSFVDAQKAEGNPLLGMFLVPFPATVDQSAELAALENLLCVTVALARYRSEHGLLPEHLEDLVPNFLGAVHACPYSGEHLRYDGDRVWSVGADGVDDNGESPLGYDQGVVEDGDVVFTLHMNRLRVFPWPDDAGMADRDRVESLIRQLLAGGERGETAGDSLAAMGREFCGRLISEFKRIDDEIGLDETEGQRRASVIDETLRRVDGVMECYWLDWRGAGGDDVPPRAIAERWTNWWYRDQWWANPQSPYED